MRLKPRTDANQPEIVACFRALGCGVGIYSGIGKDWPDIGIGVAGHNCLVEIKMPNGKLSKGQQKFQDEWPGATCVIRTTEQAVQLVNYMRDKYDGIEFDFKPEDDM